MKNNQELKKCQNIIHEATIAYLKILSKKALLEESIKQNYNNHLDLVSSIRTIQETLYSSLLIDINAWIIDFFKNDSKNLSVYQLLNKLKRKDNDFIIKLKKYYINPPSKNITDKLYTEKRAKEFDENIKICIDTYDTFIESDIGSRIKKIRDKVLVHKEKNYDIEKEGHNIGEAIEAMEEIKIIIVLLYELFRKTYYPIKEEEQDAIKKAKAFWQYVFNR